MSLEYRAAAASGAFDVASWVLLMQPAIDSSEVHLIIIVVVLVVLLQIWFHSMIIFESHREDTQLSIARVVQVQQRLDISHTHKQAARTHLRRIV